MDSKRHTPHRKEKPPCHFILFGPSFVSYCGTSQPRNPKEDDSYSAQSRFHRILRSTPGTQPGVVVSASCTGIHERGGLWILIHGSRSGAITGPLAAAHLDMAQAPAGTESARVRLSVRKWEDYGTLVAHFDMVEFEAMVFVDGFESGDLTAWSSVGP